MSDQIREKRTVTRRDFFKLSGLVTAWMVLGAQTVARAVQRLADSFLSRIEAAYAQDKLMPFRKSQDNIQVQSLYTDFLGQPLGEKSESLLHTAYVDRSGAVSAIRPRPVLARPESLAIASIYPNPFNATTEIVFRISEPGMVWLAIFNAKGQRVRSLAEGFMPAGTHQIRWDGRDGFGSNVSSGQYIARLVSGSGMASQHMTLLK